MNTLKDICLYLVSNYPAKSISNARLTKMVYLADWKCALHYPKQMTEIEWYFDTYGPFVWDIEEMAKKNPDTFEIKVLPNPMNDTGITRTIALSKMEVLPKVSRPAEGILDHVLAKTAGLSWSEFIKLVYSTYPVAKSEQFKILDLVTRAAYYKLTEMWKQSSAVPYGHKAPGL